MAWPPTLDQLKVDLQITDDRDDESLAVQLAAAVAFVERVHADRFEFDPVYGTTGLPDPGAEKELGALRLAGRWYSRRRSPDGLVALGDLGTSNIPNFDSDIERLLEIGRYGGSLIV